MLQSGIFWGGGIPEKYGFRRPDLKMIILIDSNINMVNVLWQCLVKRTGTQEHYILTNWWKSIDQEIKWIKVFVKSTMQMNDFVYHICTVHSHYFELEAS